MTPSYSTARTPSSSYAFGRTTTPSTTNRPIPSISNGKATPSTALPKSRVLKTPTSKTSGVHLSGKITAGSRASKYITMTAKQLTTRDRGDVLDSPTRKFNAGSSPTMARAMSSPTRLPGSPFTTPKALNGRPSLLTGSPLPSSRSRPSINTPRARVPSNVSMPPPPSPGAFQIRSAVSEDFASCPSPNYDLNGRMSYKPVAPAPTSRPSSSASFRSTAADDAALVEQLQSRLEAAEYENARLRTASEVETGATASTHQELAQAQSERQDALDNTTRLESQLSEMESRIKDYTDRIQTLESESVALSNHLEEARSQTEEAILAHHAALEEHSLQKQSLEDKLAELEELEREKSELQRTNAALIQELQCKLEKLNTDMELERRDLMAQIDELRIAGQVSTRFLALTALTTHCRQETIALYEERLSAANGERYELENRIYSLESKIKAMVDAERSSASPTAVMSSAAQIDNETLRDQVQYLQRKSAKLEEQLEDTRAALERDVSGYQDKISLMRLDDEKLKRDLGLKSREVEQLLKSETFARNRVEEIEEALRESTVALETARGEVEALRAELDVSYLNLHKSDITHHFSQNLDVLIDDASEDDISSKLVNFTKRVAAEKVHHQQEIDRLGRAVADLQTHNKELLQKSTTTAVNGQHTQALETDNDDVGSIQ